MMIGGICYILFIWPIHFILEFIFVLFNRIFGDPGAAVVFLSVVVNTLSLPMYLRADRWQKEERALQKRMKKKLDAIRSAFRGDERQMIINAYYRQTGYSPVFILKASVGLLMQIPFFIAAYQFLSHTSMLSGVSFLFLPDLNAPDGLLRLNLPFTGMTAVNVMPVIMTAVNLLASLVYAKGLGKRELIQLFAMAFLFLVLLYQSPSGLVLYWTVNNVYSFFKNTAQAFLKKPGRALYAAALLAAAVFIYLIWSGRASVERYRILFSFLALGLAALPFIWRGLTALLDKVRRPGDMAGLYFSAVLSVFLLLGFLNPAQILSASAADFDGPWSFMGRTLLQGLSLLFLVPLFIRALAPPPVRRNLSALWPVLALSCFFCYFAFSAYYGVMDRDFTLSDTDRLLNAFPLWISIAVPLGSAALTAVFIFLRKEKILTVLFQAGCAALFVLGMINLVSLGKSSAELSRLAANETVFGNEPGKTWGDRSRPGLNQVARVPASRDQAVYFPLSKTEPNVFIVFLDRAQGSAMTGALLFMPSLWEELDGFTFYPNTLSFGSCTVTGVPAMLGGYAYTPLAVNERKDELLVDKVNKALTLLSRLFGESGRRVTITDPVIANMQSVADTSIFKDIPNVNARLLSGKLAARFRSEFPGSEEAETDSFDFDILFRYGIFRASLPSLRYGIYYKGQWWREAAYNSYGRALAEFSGLYYLSELCAVDGGGGTLNIFMNATTHESGAYNADFFPQSKPVTFSEAEKKRYGSADNAEYIYTFLAAMKQLSKWLACLKREGVYDNTRIIVVADHGGHYNSPYDKAGMESYNPLLMVKDFGASGTLAVSEQFMTHADTPYLAAAGLFPQTTGTGETPETNVSAGYNAAEEAKRGVLAAVSEISSQPLRHGPYGFNLNGVRILQGREVLKRESWGEWEDF